MEEVHEISQGTQVDIGSIDVLFTGLELSRAA